MPRKSIPDYEHMTIEDLCSLSSYQYRKYRIWLEGRQKKKEIQTDFNDFLNKSCKKYEGSDKNERL